MIEQQPYIQFQLVDDSESLATQRYHVHRGTQPATAHNAATNLRGRIGAMSGCAFLQQSYVLPAVEVATPNTIPGVVTQQYAVFVFSTTEIGQYAIIAIPGVRFELLMTTGPGAGVLLDTEHAAVAALVAELTNGSWCNQFGYILTELEAAYRQVRDAVFVPEFLA